MLFSKDQGPVPTPHSYSPLFQTQRNGVDDNNELKLQPPGIARATENTTLPGRPLNEDPNCTPLGEWNFDSVNPSGDFYREQ